MPQGLEVWDAQGNLVISIDTRLMRTLSLLTTGTSDGSTTVAGADQGQLAVAARNSPNDGTTPTVTVSGSTVSWTFGAVPVNERRSVNLIVMVY